MRITPLNVITNPITNSVTTSGSPTKNAQRFLILFCSIAVPDHQGCSDSAYRRKHYTSYGAPSAFGFRRGGLSRINH